ncbi:MAG: nucleotidyltransferase domain-containing protein [Prevotellaceae bacterium]|jgi:predicted nucleotidyltransferase|nr:nucleotidyltransferase domain-containing protein [Prevotellaceae bacterium]
MDKNDAIRISKNYIKKVRQNGIPVLDSWLFGSYAKGTYHKDSDIDLAIILPDNQMSFDMDVRLMALRKDEETIIETHTYSSNDFLTNTPIIEQIKRYGFHI